MELPSGATLVRYADGLVERRDDDTTVLVIRLPTGD
jgi:hypothetical protein